MYAWNGVVWDYTYIFVCADYVFVTADNNNFSVYSGTDLTISD
jgi:hypothetical protein